MDFLRDLGYKNRSRGNCISLEFLPITIFNIYNHKKKVVKWWNFDLYVMSLIYFSCFPYGSLVFSLNLFHSSTKPRKLIGLYGKLSLLRSLLIKFITLYNVHFWNLISISTFDYYLCNYIYIFMFYFISIEIY